MNEPPAFPLYPWFGGKAIVAETVWSRFGDVSNYVEPFYGGGAVHLLRPHWDWTRGTWYGSRTRVETVNDADGMVANFWRAVQGDPETVAHWADWPVNEVDLHARHLWLKQQRASLAERLMADPDWYDAKIAGWWVWGISQWIGGGFTTAAGPWIVRDGRLVRKDEGDAGEDVDSDDPDATVKRQRPHLSNAGVGIHKASISIARQRPHLGDAGVGIHKASISITRRRPSLAHAGIGIHKAEIARYTLIEVMQAYANRMRRVRVCCGDWSRVINAISVLKRGSLTGIFFDPPYPAEAGRDDRLYSAEDLTVSNAVYEWCLEHGDDPDLRIAFCSYAGVYEFPASWETYSWRAPGGYGLLGNGRGLDNRAREVIYFSPHCLRLQPSLWEKNP